MDDKIGEERLGYYFESPVSGFKRGTIDIAARIVRTGEPEEPFNIRRGPTQIEYETVPALVKEGIAVNGNSRQGYAVTDVHSGLAFARFNQRRVALRAAMAISRVVCMNEVLRDAQGIPQLSSSQVRIIANIIEFAPAFR